jgi:hypothetical protein
LKQCWCPGLKVILIYANVHTDDGQGEDNTGPGDFPSGEIRGQLLEEDEEDWEDD